MTTWVFLCAVSVLKVLTFLLPTYISHRFIIFPLFLFSHFSITESALSGVCMALILLTSFTCMVRLDPTSSAEVLVARSTLYSMLSHVNRSFWWDRLTIIVFWIEVDLSWLNFHHVSTWAINKIVLILDELLKLRIIDLFELLLWEVILQFSLLQWLLTLRAIEELLLHQCIEGSFLEAIEVNCVEAFRRL